MEDPTTPSERPASPGQSRRGAIVFAAVMVVVIAVIAIVLLAGGDDGDDSETASGDCEDVAAATPKDVDLPAPKLKRPTASAIVFETSCGTFTVGLDAERAPKTAASFQYLAEQGVYDGTPFHRVAPGFVIQGGDPSGDGTGGPGYSITERPPQNLSYTRGLVAMAKTGAEPPGTSGSQFFVITAEADAGLPADYALVGEVTDGFGTIEAIEALGTPGSDGPPSMDVVIETATVEG
jgi:peptidyl-prolyl cis-trans isomerase B (cyclophilin B)